LRFQVAVKYSILVAEGCTHEELVHEAPNGVGVEGTTITVGVHILLEIALAVLEDENEFGFRVDDIIKTDNVDVLELLHEGDLANCSGRGALLSIKVYFLQSNNLICCPGTAL
jgi:hypothetical protein